MPNGERVLMPAGSEPVVTDGGDWLLTESNGSTARLPKEGYYFDYLEETVPKAPPDVSAIGFGDWSDEDYRFCKDEVRRKRS